MSFFLHTVVGKTRLQPNQPQCYRPQPLTFLPPGLWQYGAESWAGLLFLGCMAAILLAPAGWFSLKVRRPRRFFLWLVTSALTKRKHHVWRALSPPQPRCGHPGHVTARTDLTSHLS